MKTPILFFILLFSTLVLVTPRVEAAIDRQPKTIAGKVLLPDGSFAKDAQVWVTCGGSTLTDTVSQFGNYSVTYPDLECEQFEPLQISAELNGQSASISTEVVYFKTNTMEDMTLTAVSVPEFGILTGIMAAGLSIAGFIVIRTPLLWRFHF